ncbi:uncharacterized protein LOC125656484 [Ostrea edulis]|uniref:uncharacterized protein LOC125656484 n=1 Tax=Ostrea edulis TaxID=37623 RepID=UPI0024AEDDA7|nr:uncharacterized protein LOC125656484 [Ostrea edulis]
MCDRDRKMFLLMLLITVLPELCDSGPDQECSFDIPTFTGSLGKYCEETLHSLNCSVGPRRNIDKDTTLQCKIKRMQGWDAYQKTLGNLSLCQYEDCEPAQLVSLEVARIKQRGYLDEVNSWPAIQLNFTVPKATTEKLFYTGGISLTFSSDSQMTNGDYNFDTRYRLLDFSNYSYSSPDNDKRYQRILSFPCFVGFHHDPCQSDNYKVYTLTLKSFSKFKTNEGRTPFTELSYNITIYDYYVYHPYKWKSTIAVAFFPGEKDVTFLFDPAPVSVTYYQVSLFNVNDNTTYRHEKIGQSTKHCFKDVMEGTYYITIMVISDEHDCSESCRLTKSHIFTVGNPNVMRTRVTYYDSSSSGNIRDIRLIFTAVGCGVVVGLVVLGVFCYYRWNTNKQIKKSGVYSVPKVLLVYSNTTPESCNIAFEFARFCKENLHTDILNDNIKHEMSISNDNKTSEHICSHWYSEKLSKSSAAIILWTPSYKPKEEDDRKNFDEFDIGVRLALNSKGEDDFKAMCVYFDEAHRKSIPTAIQTEARVFHFPNKSKKFCAYVLGHKISRHIPISKELSALICDLSLNTRSMGTKRKYASPHLDAMCDEETKDKNRTLEHDVRHEFVVSKSEETETHPLIPHDDLQKISPDIHTSIDSEKDSTSFERDIQCTNLRCTNQLCRCSETSHDVHRHVLSMTSPDSVSTLQLFGSGEIQNHEFLRRSSNDNSSAGTYSSYLSISHLKFKTMGSTPYDNSSQSSGYVCCKSISSASSSTHEYESIAPSRPTPHQYERLQPVEVDWDSISDSFKIHEDSKEDAHVHSETFSMSPLHTMSQHRTIDFESYSVSSESIRSSEIDLSQFT